MSNVSSRYAPDGEVLISVSCNGIDNLDDDMRAAQIKIELSPWFGEQLSDWTHVKTYKIPYALPSLLVLKDDLQTTDFKIDDMLYVCGDHLMNGSLNAAMKSGRLVAESIIAEHS